MIGHDGERGFKRGTFDRETLVQNFGEEQNNETPYDVSRFSSPYSFLAGLAARYGGVVSTAVVLL